MLAVLVAAPVAAAAGPSGTATATAGWKSVSYHSLTLRVPAAWPVYDLALDPSRCVRLDVHAVYLGTPGPTPACPAHIAGHTEAVQVRPAGVAVPAPGATRAARVGANSGVVSTNPIDRSIDALVPTLGLRVTVSYGTDPSLANTIVATLAAGSPASGGAVAATTPAGTTAAGTTPDGESTPNVPAATGGGIFTGRAFDTCSAPSTSTTQAFLASPYRGIGIYVGGANRACGDGNLSASWVSAVTAQGWRLIPIYVGLQSPSVSQGGLATINPSAAATEGVQAADDASSRAAYFGLGIGSPIYFDMEGYDRSVASASQAVMNFIAAWTIELHRRGYASGFYSSSSSGIADLVAHYNSIPRPDEIWFANWNGVAGTTDAYVPVDYWPLHQRMHQYFGPHAATYGGVTIDIDSDAVDADVAVAGGSTGLPFTGTPIDTNSPAVAETANTVNLLTRSSGGILQTKTWSPGSGWSNWTGLGGILTSSPGASAQSGSQLATAVRGRDGAAWVMRSGGGQGSWTSLGGVLTSAPAIAAWANNHLSVAVRGFDGATWWRTSSDGGKTWGSWSSLGGKGMPDSAPALTATPNGGVAAFVEGEDGREWVDTLTGGSWSGWQSLGGWVRGDVAATVHGYVVETFVRGKDNALWHRWRIGNVWSGWQSMGGILTSSPGSGSIAQRADVAVIGKDGNIWMRTIQTSTWSAWTRVP